jgi:hypothetical protein
MNPVCIRLATDCSTSEETIFWPVIASKFSIYECYIFENAGGRAGTPKI